MFSSNKNILKMLWRSQALDCPLPNSIRCVCGDLRVPVVHLFIAFSPQAHGKHITSVHEKRLRRFAGGVT